ncbi:MAG: hypothetical protein ABIN58_13315 [candidate division WOR-3 bacterium]
MKREMLIQRAKYRKIRRGWLTDDSSPEQPSATSQPADNGDEITEKPAEKPTETALSNGGKKWRWI